jgi:bacillolysin
MFMKKSLTRKFFIVGVGLLSLTPFLLGTSGPNSRKAARWQSVQGWQAKQHRQSGGAHAPLEQRELETMSERLQEAINLAPVARTSQTSRSSLAVALARLNGKPFDLAARLQQAPLQKAVAQPAIQGNIRWHEHNGTPVFINAAGWRGKAAKASSVTSTAEAALAFIDANRELFRLDNPRQELKIVAAWSDELGKQHVKMAQWYNGIPVWGHDLVAHLESNGELYALNARYSPTPNEIDLAAPSIDASQAIRIAEGNLATRVTIEKIEGMAKQILAYEGPRATRYIWVDQETQKAHLIWHVQIRPNLQDNWYYFVDANSGQILERYNATNFDGPATATATDLNNQTQTINVYQKGTTYYLIDASRPIFQANQPDIINDAKGALVTVDVRNNDLGNQTQVFHVTSTNNAWTDRVSVSAHSNVARVFEYYFNTYQRRSIDGNNGTIYSIIHVTQDGKPMDNAYWNGVAMAYGDGNIGFKPLAGGLDVAAHEMTHGVIDYTVKLEYKFQSGALNESYADVFGVMVDRDDWLMGEDVTKTSYIPSGALRNMQDPHNGGSSDNDNGWQPAHMNEILNYTIDQDNGGVHGNSGIPNRACYLIGNAIGKDKTEKIYYRILAQNYLNSQAQFIDQRLAAIQAATDLKNSGQLTDADIDAVKAGFDGVGITDGTSTKPPTDLPPVQGDQFVAFVNAETNDHSLWLANPVVASNADFTQLTTTQVFADASNPISVSDNGQTILFVDSQNFVRVINSDGTGEQVISTQGVWKSIALSPNATMLAATSVFEDSTIYIFDLVNSNNSKAVHLYSPTTGQGVEANSAVYSDALDWNSGSEFVIYDALNRIPQAGGGKIEYWDINILDVASGVIIPIFPPQPEGISIGNPSLAQTNDNFLVMDYADFNQGIDNIVAIDLFTGDANIVLQNGASIAYPKYSTDDSRLVFQRVENGSINLRQVQMAANKIQAASPSQGYVLAAQLPTWFAIGQRTKVDDKSEPAPVAYALHQNYPNPFNPQTEIQFDLAQRGHAVLSVYNLAGQEVARLIDATLPPGTHRVSFNAAKLPSGIYFYRLQTGVFGATKRMLVIK